MSSIFYINSSKIAQTPPKAVKFTMNTDIQTYNNDAETAADKEIFDRLAEILDQNLPQSESKVWHRHPVWFLDGNPIVGYSKRKDGINLMFWSGQSFDEPQLLAEGNFKAAEIRYSSVLDIDEADLKRWLRKAHEIQWDYKNIVERKGVLERLK